MDGVQKANSGHPGTPMALAPVTYAIWNDAMRYDPAHPQWPARDRFVLSCGHASMLLYAMLHLSQVQQTDDAGTGHRQDWPLRWTTSGTSGSCTVPVPAIPNTAKRRASKRRPGLWGRVIGNSVGMAIAAQWLAARYDRPDFALFGNNVYALCSDGDLMEGVACEAASLAGHLKLANLCWIYDDNHITIEGDTELAFSEDVAQRFQGLGWKTIRVDDANDVASAAARPCRSFRPRMISPTLIIVRSVIGFGSPQQGQHARRTRGAPGRGRSPTDQGRLRLARRRAVPRSRRRSSSISRQGLDIAAKLPTRNGRRRLRSTPRNFHEQATELQAIWRDGLPADWEQGIPCFEPDAKGLATRVTSGKVLNELAPHLPWLIGGSADLAPSNMTHLAGDYGGPFLRGELRRPQHALRHSRTRHGIDLQRDGFERTAAVLRHLLCLHRLHATGDAAERSHASERDLRADT